MTSALAHRLARRWRDSWKAHHNHAVRRHAVAMFGVRYWLLPGAAAAGVLAAWVAFPFVFERYGHLSPVGWRPSLDLVAAVWLMGLAIAPPVSYVLVYSSLWGRARRDLLRGAHCMSCDFSLVGLRVRGGMVLCPECGSCLQLSRWGWSESDV